ncbi:MAG: hypothetical protein MZW92_39130 [Comamonadaceae bacterium]|nr:hypothetical protein [Comamonadaceae bacterium]
MEAGQPLFHIADLKRLWIEARIPESQVRQAQESVRRLVPHRRLRPELRPRGRQERPPGRLRRCGGQGQPQRALILAFDNPQGHLRVGMAVQAHVVTDAVREALAVPVAALIDDAGQMVAFVQKSGEAFERRTARAGRARRRFRRSEGRACRRRARGDARRL